MDLTFDADAVRRWADFAGDHNPIHFDRRRAQAAGAADVVVHGMLALLPVKQALTDHLIAGLTGARWLRVKTLFKAPVLRDRRHHVRLRQRSPERVDFVLETADGGRECCRGSAAAVPPPTAATPAADAEAPADVPGRTALFARAFPEFGALWIALDAIAFGHFLQSRRGLLQRLSGANGSPAAGIGADAGTVMMQTSQQVTVAPAYARAVLPGSFRLDRLRCAVALAPVVAGGAAVSGAVQLTTSIDGDPVAYAEIGLMARRIQPATAD